MKGDLILTEEVRPGVALVTLNRPDKRNALNIPLLEDLATHVETLNKTRGQRVIILTGAGEAFCAGLDLAEARDEALAHKSAGLVARCLRAVMGSPCVTIGAANGAALAGGAGLLLACDISVVSERFKTGFPEVRRGLVAGLVMTFLRRKVGEARAREMLLLGEVFDARQALEAGIVSRLVNPEEVLPTAKRLAEQALLGAPGAIAKTKRLLDELWDMPVGKHIERAQALHQEMRTTEEAREGLLAFEEKRLPSWAPPSQVRD